MNEWMGGLVGLWVNGFVCGWIVRVGGRWMGEWVHACVGRCWIGRLVDG